MVWGTRIFAGSLPRTDARVLEAHQGEEAHNCWLGARTIAPMPSLVGVMGGVAANTRSLYRFSPTQWFAWSDDVDAVRAPIAGDSDERTLWTGQGFPRMTDLTIMGVFSGPGVPISRRLGIPAPTQAAVATLTPAVQPDIDPQALAVTHSWVYTYVSDKNEEGPPASPSPLISRTFDTSGAIAPVELSNLRAGPTGPYGVANKRIYRTVTSEAGITSFQFLAEIPVAQTSFTDTALASALGGALVSGQWDPPPDDLEGLIALGNGICAGFVGRDVYFSEPYQPHAWPKDYIQPVTHDIVGLGAFGTTLVITTKGLPYVASGTHPSSMALARQELVQSCVSKRSIARIGEQGVVYASPDGLVLIGPGGGRLITRAAYALRDWRAIGAQNILGAYQDNQYIAFLDGSTIAFDPENAGVTTFADNTRALYSDLEEDRLYIIVGTNILEWRTVREGMEALRSFRWRSRPELGALRAFSAAQVIAKDYPITLKVLGDGAVVDTIVVPDSNPFRLLAGGRYSEWAYQLEGTVEVREVRIGTMAEMLGG